MEYRTTTAACYLGYVVQAIVNTFVPLLLLTFRQEYGISTAQMTLLITSNFLIQLLTDLLSPLFVDRIGYRAAAALAHVLTAAGLAGLSFVPDMTGNPFCGLVVCVILYAVGGGLLEVVISPIIEALPLKNKEKHMSLLHSFYCWGQVGVVLLSTLFFSAFGVVQWRIAACIWAGVTLLNVFLFAVCPIHPLLPPGEKGDSLFTLMKLPLFWVMILMMVCSGASNNGVSQWLSTFLENGLGLPKDLGDVLGPCGFAALMGLSRVLYARWSARIELKKAMLACSLCCTLSYLLIALSGAVALNLLGCLLCGFSVGLMWPGTFSLASAGMKKGGTLLFALLALAGDVGCAAGPGLVGLVSDAAGAMKPGVLAGSLFPLCMMFCALWLVHLARKGI